MRNSCMASTENQAIRSTHNAEGRKRAGNPVTAVGSIYADSGIGAYAVYHPIVSVGTLPINAELSVIKYVAGCDDHSGCEFDQTLEAAAVQRKALREMAIHDGAHRAVCDIHIGGVSFYRD